MSELSIQLPRKANECFIDNKRFREARPLFDEFWREGELALLFGAAGTGKSVLVANGFSVVVIDDLSAVKNTHDGTCETLRLMRRLRRLRDELNISILVLTDSNEPGRSGIVAAADLGRSRVLCSVADSVFAIGNRLSKGHDRYIIQLRSRGASVFWTGKNAPAARVERFDTGMIGFVFDGRFAQEMDDETRAMILRVKSMHDRAHTFRMIAETLGISKTRVHRLYKKWTPAMEPEKPESKPVPEFYALDRCIYVGCMNCNFCGGRRGHNRRSVQMNINGHKDCPDDCDLCGPRPYAANDTTADPN